MSGSRKIIVIGASAGGVDVVRTLLAGLPKDFRASVFVVLPIDDSAGQLPSILSAVGPLPAVHPKPGQAIEEGIVYVAPPDLHMLLTEPGRVTLTHGPKENFSRPAINPLFRSAAATYGRDVTGIILSGNLDDGVIGLAEVKRRGGRAIVQDPKTAVYPSMPSSAVEAVAVDYIVPAEDIAAVLLQNSPQRTSVSSEEEVQQQLADLACPECRGPLSEMRSGNLTEYKCRVGHAYSLLALAHDQQTTVERNLWQAVIALQDSAEISDNLALRFGDVYRRQARDRREQASVLQDVLNDVKDRFRVASAGGSSDA